MQQAFAALNDYGFASPTATAILEQVVNRPSAAGQLRTSGGIIEVCQSALVTAAGSTVYVELSATITPGLPPEVAKVDVEAFPVVVDDDDLCTVAERLETMRARLRVDHHLQHPDAPREVLILGMPTPGYLETPPDWEARLRTTAAVVGLRLSIVAAPRELSSQALAERADLVVVITGRDWRLSIERFDQLEKPVERIGSPGATFQSLHSEFRQHIVAVMWGAALPSGTGPIELLSGQRVYHRKVPGGRGFDRFDDGSDSPCAHGKDGFVAWSGDKASKGMLRRYSNFRLLHCSQYPNCGMYAVEGA
ncbi:hypothetical protein E1258_07530 [Micromonospora sp. KC207]|uniref:hypothetical protein n=1 Tax=Micromonospora sp. KC207 TaxID=2530377 RepID=UPI00104CE782|nr:hypothetical protein [Micromonospora sp. KC207]TDC64741.1 hypothetical protein E1258_07530 [Micromonospora sp. KC207]